MAKSITIIARRYSARLDTALSELSRETLDTDDEEAAKTHAQPLCKPGVCVIIKPNYNDTPAGYGYAFHELRSLDGGPWTRCTWSAVDGDVSTSVTPQDIATAQQVRTITIDDVVFERIAYGDADTYHDQHATQGSRCPDCSAGYKELHVMGCDVERCPKCRGQLISCNCDPEANGANDVEE